MTPLVVGPTTAAGRTGRLGQMLIGLAVIAGTGITLYRNGVVLNLARAMHQEAPYQRFEAALGGPSFGTLRAIDSSPAQQSTTSHSSDPALSINAATPSPSPAADSQGQSGSSAPAVSLDPATPADAQHVDAPVSAAKPALAVAHPAKRTPPTSQKAANKSGSRHNEQERLNAAIGDSMSGSKAARKPGKGKSSEYDPLNPKL